MSHGEAKVSATFIDALNADSLLLCLLLSCNCSWCGVPSHSDCSSVQATAAAAEAAKCHLVGVVDEKVAEVHSEKHC